MKCRQVWQVQFATGQEIARENWNTARSDKNQVILILIKENWYFEEKSAKIEII